MNTNDWRHYAACREEDPELFFPPSTEGASTLAVEQAKAVCTRCPVVDSCLRFALDENIPAGIFGGLTADERRSINRAATRKNLTAEETTQRAQHARQHTKPNTLQQLFETNTVRLFGGHLAWTGPSQAWFQGRPYTPKKLAFVIDRGREPEGRVLNDCGNSECVLAAHVADDAERMRCGTRPGYQRHQRNGETPCDACRQASAEHRRQYETTEAAA